MKRIHYFFLLIALSGFTYGQEADPVLVAPGDWTYEKLTLPLSFAPDIPLTGYEEVRFSPQWNVMNTDGFWTYAFAWVLKQPLNVDKQTLATYLESYYDGLMQAVGKFETVDTQVALQENESGYESTVVTKDGFFTNAEIRLHLKITTHQKGCLWVFKLSPKPKDHTNWEVLQAIRPKALKTVTLSGKFKTFDGISIAYTDTGSGYPVLLLHGFINSGNSWNKTELKKALIAQGFRAIVPDLRGNGQSDKPQLPDSYHHDAEVKDLLALADHLNLTAYHAVGYSRGSIVLAKLLTQELQITKAVLGGMGADFTDPDWERRKAFADAFSGRKAADTLTSGAIAYAESIGADLKVLGHLQDFQPVTRPTELNNIRIPVLIACGDADTDNGDPKELQAMIPKSEMILLKGDHNNTYKQADFAGAVIDFLTKN